MKKIGLILIMSLMSILPVLAKKTYCHDGSCLPTAATVVLKKNFKSQVSLVKVDKDFGRVSEYEVVLRDGTEVTFDKAGNWKEIETSNRSKVPDAMIPAPILQYVKEHQNKAKIVGIEKDRMGYEVTLNNGVEMKFDRAARFLKYDD